MCEHLHNDKGFTLIELVMATALSTMVVTGLMSVFWFGYLFMNKNQELTDARYSARQALEHITRDVRLCRKFEVCNALNQPVAPGQTGVKLRLLLPENRTVMYYVASQNLYRQNITDSNTLPVALCINQLKVLCPQPGLLEIDLVALAGEHSYSLHTAVKSRSDTAGDW